MSSCSSRAVVALCNMHKAFGPACWAVQPEWQGIPTPAGMTRHRYLLPNSTAPPVAG